MAGVANISGLQHDGQRQDLSNARDCFKVSKLGRQLDFCGSRLLLTHTRRRRKLMLRLVVSRHFEVCRGGGSSGKRKDGQTPALVKSRGD